MVVAAGVELLAYGLGRRMRRALYPREGRNMCFDIGTEASVDQNVAIRVLHQDRCGGEVTDVAE